MSKDQIIVIRGEFNWAKIVGDARAYTGNPKFDKGPYWSIDVTPDAKSRQLLKAAGISDKLRTPNDNDKRKETFLTLKVLKNKSDGTPNLDGNGKQIIPSVIDSSGRNWGQDLIGNGSVGDVKIKVKDYGTTTGAYLQAVRVLKHVPYEGGGFAPLTEDDEWYAGGNSASSAGADVASPAQGGARPVDDFDDSEIPF